MTEETVWIAVLVLVASGALTGAIRRLALARGLLDVPNARSSHDQPKPRGGGAAIVLTTLAALLLLFAVDLVPFDELIALGGGGAAVALVGFWDDRRSLSPVIRLTVHFAAALWAMAWLGGLPPLQVGTRTIDFHWFGYVLGSLSIVWTLNLFNFMDGIDGIAASEAIFILLAAQLLVFVTNGTLTSESASALVLAAACVGFLVWNWPPARIFMGDVGSGYLGYFISVLAIAAGRDNRVALFVYWVLGGVFFVDATVTLVRRIMHGERPTVSHRSHAYQWLARSWGSHARVTLAVGVANIVWLLPCAFAVTRYPSRAILLTALALGPVTIAVIAAGAGRCES